MRADESAGFPGPDEHPAYQAAYLAHCHGEDPLPLLSAQLERTLELMRGLDEKTALYRYAPEKWSVKEVLGHVIDVERVFAYRVLSLARGATVELPGFDENAYVAAARFDRRTVPSLGEELEHLRRSNLALFATFHREAWRRRGLADGQPASVRAMVWVIAGHQEHHLEVLGERYLGRSGQGGAPWSG